MWIGHDWGSPVVWNIASHHPEKTTGVASLCVPYFAEGFTLHSIVPLVNRTIYPEDEYPAGQWDYMLYYQESFDAACKGFDDDVRNVVKGVVPQGEFGRRGQPQSHCHDPKLEMPALFLHAAYDAVCETTTNSRFAVPMRRDCHDLTEVVVHSGHWMAQEQPVAVNIALAKWLAAKLPDYWNA